MVSPCTQSLFTMPETIPRQVCKCGGEVITGSLRTIKALAYTGAALNALQGLMFFLLMLGSVKELGGGGVIFVLILIAW
jgi:hypothetical protein